MKRKSVSLIGILCFVLMAFSVYAQKQGKIAIDSMMLDLPKQKEDTNKVKLLLGISAGYYAINPDEGIKYGKQALSLSEKLQWEKGIAKAYNVSGNSFMRKTDYDTALEYYLISIKINEKLGDEKGVTASLGNIGTVYQRQDNTPKALEYDFKALKINEKLNNKTLMAINLNNIGIIYLNNNNDNDNQKALEYYLKALQVNEEIKNKTGMLQNLGNLGITYGNLKNYPKALEYASKGLKIAEETGEKLSIAAILNIIGPIYKHEANYSKALEYSFRALKIDEEANLRYSMTYVYGQIGETYLDIAKDSIHKGEEERIKGYIRMYLNAAAVFEEKAKAAIESKDREKIAALMHLYKPKWAMMGMSISTELGQQVEMLCMDEGNEGKIKEYIHLIIQLNKNSISELA